MLIRNHVAERAGRIVVATAFFDRPFSATVIWTWSMNCRVPDRLEDPVRETERQDVLNGLLAEIVIDPIDLVFVAETCKASG